MIRTSESEVRIGGPKRTPTNVRTDGRTHAAESSPSGAISPFVTRANKAGIEVWS